jgi:hypothetical protein
MANFQNIVPKRLAQAAMTTAFASIYTVPVNTRTFVKDMDICNTTATAVTFSVCLVPYTATNTVGTAGTANALLYNVALPANSTMQWTGSQLMNGPANNTQAGDTIWVKASATGVTITISGGEAT